MVRIATARRRRRKRRDDGRLRWTSRIDDFSAVEVCQPVGTAESGRFGQLGQLVVVVELAAPTAALLLLLGARWRRTGCGGWNSLGKREMAMRGCEVRGSSKRAFKSKKKAAKVNRGFQECAAPSAAWMEDAQASMGDARDVVANGEVTTCQRSIFWPSPSTATPSHQNRK